MTRLSPLLFTLAWASSITTVVVYGWVVPRAPGRTTGRAPLNLATIDQGITGATVDKGSSTVSTSLDIEFAAALQRGQAQLKAGLPPKYQDNMWPILEHFSSEYITACQASYQAGNVETCEPSKSMDRFVTAVGYGLKYGFPGPTKYSFLEVTHKALRGLDSEVELNPGKIDFYSWGCEFFRSCMDLERSAVFGQENLRRLAEQIQAGHNVVLMANHQSEADPQVVSCMFEKAGYKKEAEDMVYVAGHKVTTDPLAVPFSMGRNLICIHSKKHINSDPDTKSVKQRQNLMAMQALNANFKAGGCLLWVAPSGGRDRRDMTTGRIPIAPFDSKTIDMFRLIGNKSGVPTHYYTMAMITYDLCPPPDYTVAGVGEERNVRFVPVGIAIGNECESTGGLEGRKEFCQHAQEQCEQDYAALGAALGYKY